MAKNFKFLKYQWDWINNPGKFAIAEKSRRVGITYAECYRCTRDLAAKKVKNNKIWFSSADLSASEEAVDYVGYWAKVLNTAAKYVGEVVIDKEDDITAHRVRFSNGAEFNAISSNPTRFRSKGGDVILDEFAHHRDAEKMYTAAKPSMMWGNRVRVISTHNGEDTYFNFLISEIKKGKEGSMIGWSHFKTTIEDAIKDGLVDVMMGHKATKNEIADYLAELFSGMTREAIDEEFYCIPRSNSSNHILPYELINPIERDNILDEELSNIQGDLYVGMDIGRFNNPSVIWVLERLGEIHYTRKVIRLKNTRWEDQREYLHAVLSHPNFRRCCIDNSSMGTELFEKAEQTFGSSRVEGIKFSNQVKDQLASNTVIMVEGKRVLIPRDKRIKEDLYSVKGVTTLSGNTRYEAEEDKEGGHADHFWALALALEAAKSYAGPVIITTGGKRIINSILTGY